MEEGEGLLKELTDRAGGHLNSFIYITSNIL